MRLSLLCLECSGKNHEQFSFDVSPNNEGIYEVKCPNGHIFKIDILLHEFQVLFENGIHSLSDGYYMESFLSIVKCYERFLEFFIKIVILSKGISEDMFNETWNKMSKQSERQLGAFIIIFLNEFGDIPELLSTNNKKEIPMRNKVVHQGYLPSQEDCIAFGNAVLRCVRPTIEQLKSKREFDYLLTKSVNRTGNFDRIEINERHFPYQIFAINRPINETDSKIMQDFLSEQYDIKKKLSRN